MLYRVYYEGRNEYKNVTFSVRWWFIRYRYACYVFFQTWQTFSILMSWLRNAEKHYSYNIRQ